MMNLLHLFIPMGLDQIILSICYALRFIKMAIPAPLGLTGFGTPVKGDQATAVASGSFTAVGASIPFAFYGLANFSLYCEVVDLLTTTQGTFTATVTGATS